MFIAQTPAEVLRVDQYRYIGNERSSACGRRARRRTGRPEYDYRYANSRASADESGPPSALSECISHKLCSVSL
ncbi:hypothetical protein EVAR_66956_1 [Eumeta japonica]|uniref:Uncharacterized protein n=1 Tax=Eumeta variegata TaxID=151549 RepID=A0A4C1ZUX8_EUMVA|nr:hypothetical protein EVAR_66956_1 [Eumeta japonica]